MSQTEEREPGAASPLGPIQSEITSTRAWVRPASQLERHSGTGRLLAITVAVAIAAGTFLMLGFRADSQLTYDLRGASAQGGVMVAERGEATVSLSDGSSILAENQTKFSVEVVGRNAALTRLVSGKLHVRVAHNDDTSYRFLAGPYEVRVVGTELDLSWDASAGLTVVMLNGEVKLAEPNGKVHTLTAGQSLSLPPGGALPDPDVARR